MHGLMILIWGKYIFGVPKRQFFVEVFFIYLYLISYIFFSVAKRLQWAASDGNAVEDIYTTEAN
jgi:hypothetical protein